MTTHTPQPALIKKIVQENEQVRSYVLDISLGGKPGQFVNVWLPGVDEKPMSIADDDGKTLMLAIGEVGTFSRALTKLQVGDWIGIRGPYGEGFRWRPKQHLIMVAGGYGAAPLYFAAKMASLGGRKIDFILGARTKDQLLYEAKLEKLPRLRLHIATDDGSKGHKGYNVGVLKGLLRDIKRDSRSGAVAKGDLPVENDRVGTCKEITSSRTEILRGVYPERSRRAQDDGKARHDVVVFTCGPEKMMKRVLELCEQFQVKSQISVERYMKCGFGVCGQCCVDDSGDPVCVKGPVMTGVQVRKIKEFSVYHRDSEGRKVYW